LSLRSEPLHGQQKQLEKREGTKKKTLNKTYSKLTATKTASKQSLAGKSTLIKTPQQSSNPQANVPLE
jgi:hypothetical protein